MARPASMICPFCARQSRSHYVHGHLQCGRCGKNIDDCCSGERCHPAGPAPGRTSQPGTA